MSSSSTRRLAVLCAALAAVLATPLVNCRGALPGGKPLRRAGQRVVVLGFDGMDPKLARRWMDEGKLPNLKALADEGTFKRLKSTQPSESPTAWSSFATGVNPGKHSIYDFLVRDLATYVPDFNMFRKEPGRFLWGMIPTQPAKVVSMRGGTSFWKTVSPDGINAVVAAWRAGAISRETMLERLKRGEVLPDGRSVAQERALIHGRTER